MSDVSDVSDAVERFARALGDVGGRAMATASRPDAVEEVRRVAGQRPVIVDGQPDLEGVADGLAVVEDPWQAEVGVTSAFLAVAETGTIAVGASPQAPRSTSLLPPVHVALLPEGRLVPTYADAMERLAGMRPLPSGVAFITGPSSSGDIELTMVRGVHGPAEVHVVFFPAADPEH